MNFGFLVFSLGGQGVFHKAALVFLANWFQAEICTESAVALRQEYLQECSFGKVTFRIPGTQVLHMPVIWCCHISFCLSPVLGCAGGNVKWLVALTELNHIG